MLFWGRDDERHRVVFGQGALAREEERLSVGLPLQTALRNCQPSCPKNPVDGLVLFVKFPARLTDLEQQA